MQLELLLLTHSPKQAAIDLLIKIKLELWIGGTVSRVPVNVFAIPYHIYDSLGQAQPHSQV